MRRIVLAAVVPAALLSAPGTALAHHHHGHAHRAQHHARRHALRHSHLLRFGAFTAPAGSPAGSPSAPSSPTPTPTPTPPQPAGKVLTFEGGVLTIALTGGEKVSGKVTEETRLICVPATPAPSTEPGKDDQGGGDDNATQRPGENGGPGQMAPGQPNGGADHQDQNDNEDDQGGDWDDQDGQPQGCETTVLTAGTPVLEAELNIGPAGAVWESLVIVH